MQSLLYISVLAYKTIPLLWPHFWVVLYANLYRIQASSVSSKLVFATIIELNNLTTKNILLLLSSDCSMIPLLSACADLSEDSKCRNWRVLHFGSLIAWWLWIPLHSHCLHIFWVLFVIAFLEVGSLLGLGGSLFLFMVSKAFDKSSIR